MLPKIGRVTRNVLALLPPTLRRLARSVCRLWPRPPRKSLRPNFRRPVPVWSLLFTLLLGSVSGIATYSGLIQISAESLSQNSPDFTISADPVSQSVPQGTLATFNIQLTSLADFAGSVTLAAYLLQSEQSISTALNPVTLSLFAGSATSGLTLSIGQGTPVGSYTLNVTGTSGRLARSVVIFLSVTSPPPPDFLLSASPPSLTITAGSSSFSAILVTSIGGFEGNVTLTATVTPVVSNRPTASLTPVEVTLSPGGTQASNLVINTTSNTPRLTYTVLVEGTSGSTSHSLAIALVVQ